MARIPRTLPEARTITPQTPGRTISRSSATGEVVNLLGQAVEEAGAKLRDAQLLAEMTRAENQRDTTLTDIHTRASLETDISDKRQKEYDEEIRKATIDSAKHISIPASRAMYQMQSEGKANITRAKVTGAFTKKTIDQGKADLENFFVTKEKEFINAGIGEKASIVSERNNKINAAVKAGYITREEAAVTINKLNKDWKKSALNQKISDNPEQAIKDIVNGDYDLRVETNDNSNAFRIDAGDNMAYFTVSLGFGRTVFGAADATPDVTGGNFWFSNAAAVIITDFENNAGLDGQFIIVVSGGATTYDVDGGLLEAGTNDLVTAAGDVTMWVYSSDEQKWYLISYMDNSIDQN